MYMIDETALIARSSSQVLFFKLRVDEITKAKSWFNYYTLDISGSI